MILTADQVSPGPHWVRLTPASDWMLLIIEQPEALPYGLARAEFVPIPKPPIHGGRTDHPEVIA